MSLPNFSCYFRYQFFLAELQELDLLLPFVFENIAHLLLVRAVELVFCTL